jgi:hypothetical protein
MSFIADMKIKQPIIAEWKVIHYYVNMSVDHNNFILLTNNWQAQIVDEMS